jgi:uncharacterized protein YukE
MATLDKIIEMQKKGIADAEISTQLQQEGINPQEINDSLNQAKIKNAVSPPEGGVGVEEGMQASVMPDDGTSSAAAMPDQQAPMEQPAPGPEVYPPQEVPGAPAPEYQGQPQEEYYAQTPQAYGGQDYYAPQGGMDTETISEIAEQVASDKMEEFQKKTGDIAAFKSSIQDKVDDIDDRLKRIESSIDKLQQAVIGKIGEFGESSALIHKDLDNLHGTVSKLMNPLIDNVNELRKISK